MNQKAPYELPDETIARLRHELAVANAEIERLQLALRQIVGISIPKAGQPLGGGWGLYTLVNMRQIAETALDPENQELANCVKHIVESPPDQP